MISKEDFIKVLAVYLTENSAAMSIWLELGMEDAKNWAKLRNATPIFGHIDAKEAEEILTRFLA